MFNFSKENLDELKIEISDDLEGYIYSLGPSFHELENHVKDLIVNAFINGYISKSTKG